ncbi:MAG: peptidase S9 prolyl oligopeptidase active site domain-containing protein [Parcubacteria group bacterium Gr01-1014_66]|nr:MAG: peptidase S9 prolyl oligopeptidase active site domain-containing protein [Parcubacteria group bacterium Gr01-1014_66]
MRVLILNHGFIPPERYVAGQGTRREQDFFARNGYVTVHPDYRAHASSTPYDPPHHDFYVGYTADVAALIDAIRESALPLLDEERIGMFGHSMGGGIAARIAVIKPEVRAYVLFAPISADVEDNFYELDPEEVAWLRKTYGEEGAEVYSKISPLNFSQDVSAPIQLHHGVADKDVPLAFSERMYTTLTILGKKAEFYQYPGQGHEFTEDWSLAARRAAQFFDMYVRGSR